MKRCRGNRILSRQNNEVLVENISQGVQFTISECDISVLRLCTWYEDTSNGYIKGSIDGRNVSLHLYLMGSKEGYIVDHKDRNKKNCTRQNLRYVTHIENNRNSDRVQNSNNRYYGVTFRSKTNSYRAYVSLSGKQLTLYSGKDPVMCAIAYDKWLIKNRPGERTNFDLGLYDIKLYGYNSPLEVPFRSKYLS